MFLEELLQNTLTVKQKIGNYSNSKSKYAKGL